MSLLEKFNVHVKKQSLSTFSASKTFPPQRGHPFPSSTAVGLSQKHDDGDADDADEVNDDHDADDDDVGDINQDNILSSSRSVTKNMLRQFQCQGSFALLRCFCYNVL